MCVDIKDHIVRKIYSKKAFVISPDMCAFVLMSEIMHSVTLNNTCNKYISES